MVNTLRVFAHSMALYIFQKLYLDECHLSDINCVKLKECFALSAPLIYMDGEGDIINDLLTPQRRRIMDINSEFERKDRV